MAGVILASGSVIKVSATAPGTLDATGYGTWLATATAIGLVENIGSVGGKSQTTNFIPIATGVVQKLKGSIDYGQLALSIGKLIADAGQVILKTGFDGAKRYDTHYFGITCSDGEKYFFSGKIGSYVVDLNDANKVRTVKVDIELDSTVIEVAGP